jgi:hypothetical protein
MIDFGAKHETYDSLAVAGVVCIELPPLLPKALLVRAEQYLCSHLVSAFSWAATTFFTAQFENIIVSIICYIEVVYCDPRAAIIVPLLLGTVQEHELDGAQE